MNPPAAGAGAGPPPDPPRFRRRQRWRLVWLALALFGGLEAALIVLLGVFLARDLGRGLDALLLGELVEIEHIAANGREALDFELAHEQKEFTLIVLLPPAGPPLFRSGCDDATLAALRVRDAAAPARTSLGVVTPAAGNPIRLAATTLPHGRLYLGRAETGIRETVRTFLTTASLGGLAMLAALALGAWQIARTVFDPIEQIAERARHLTLGQTAARVPVSGREDELDRLAALLNEMFARSEQAYAALQRFTADASHALRTPLATMRLGIEHAIATGRPADAVETLDALHEEIDRLDRLVGALLQLARSPAAAGAAGERVDLGAVARAVVEDVRAIADTKHLRLEAAAGGPAVVAGEPTLLRQLVLILVENAIRYTPPEGRVDVACRRADGRVVLQVHDTGPGVPADEVPHVFEPFFRGRLASGSEAGGAGLGLAIAASIVARHAGRIGLASPPGDGATFTVELPVAAGT